MTIWHWPGRSGWSTIFIIHSYKSSSNKIWKIKNIFKFIFPIFVFCFRRFGFVRIENYRFNSLKHSISQCFLVAILIRCILLWWGMLNYVSVQSVIEKKAIWWCILLLCYSDWSRCCQFFMIKTDFSLLHNFPERRVSRQLFLQILMDDKEQMLSVRKVFRLFSKILISILRDVHFQFFFQKSGRRPCTS